MPILSHFCLCYWILDFYIAWIPTFCQIHVLPVRGLNVHFLSGVILVNNYFNFGETQSVNSLEWEERKNGIEAIFEEPQADNFPKLLKDRNPHIQKLKLSKKKPIFRYNIEKLQNIKDKEKKKLSKNVGQGKCRFPQRRSRLTADFFTNSDGTWRAEKCHLHYNKEITIILKFYIRKKLSFKNEGEIRT